MRYMVFDSAGPATSLRRNVVVEDGDTRTAFPADVGNPVYDSFLESQSLTDSEVQAMEPDIWHDMA